MFPWTNPLIINISHGIPIKSHKNAHDLTIICGVHLISSLVNSQYEWQPRNPIWPFQSTKIPRISWKNLRESLQNWDIFMISIGDSPRTSDSVTVPEFPESQALHPGVPLALGGHLHPTILGSGRWWGPGPIRELLALAWGVSPSPGRWGTNAAIDIGIIGLL